MAARIMRDKTLAAQEEQRLATKYARDYKDSAELLSDDPVRARWVWPLLGEFAPPEAAEPHALHPWALRRAWERIAGHAGVFGTPREFLSRVRGLDASQLAGLVAAQFPALSPDAALAVASRILSSLAVAAGPRSAPQGSIMHKEASVAEVNRQVAAQVSHREPGDFAAVWRGDDPQALADMADWLGAFQDSAGAQVFRAVGLLGGAPWRLRRLPADAVATAAARLRAVPEWLLHHKLLDQVDLIHWILSPILPSLLAPPPARGGGGVGADAAPMPPITTQAEVAPGGYSVASAYSPQGVLCVGAMRKAPPTRGGQWFINGVPASGWLHRDFAELAVRPFLAAGLERGEWDIWMELRGNRSFDRAKRQQESAVALCAARLISMQLPHTRPLLAAARCLTIDPRRRSRRVPGYVRARHLHASQKSKGKRSQMPRGTAPRERHKVHRPRVDFAAKHFGIASPSSAPGFPRPGPVRRHRD